MPKAQKATFTECETLDIKIETLQNLICDVEVVENPETEEELKNMFLYFQIKSTLTALKLNLNRLQAKETEQCQETQK